MALVPLDLTADENGARLIGWSTGAEVVARATVRRLGPDELVIERVDIEAGAPVETRDELLEAIAGVATA
jgi:hypothetical protein